MHEGHHGIINDVDLGHMHEGHGIFSRAVWRKAVFPLLLLLLILASAVEVYLLKIFETDYIGIIAMLTGGGTITCSTIVSVIRNKRVTAGVLVVLALIGAAWVGEYLAGAVVSFMMIIGEFLEDVTLEHTRNAVRELVRLVPETVRLRHGDGFKEIHIEHLHAGDIVIVRPGERIPADGIVLKGEAAVDESSLTGESMPVDKGADNKVYGGSLNVSGVLEIEVKKVGRDSVLGKIIGVVQQAQENKGGAQRLADRFAGYFTPAVLAVCVLVWFLNSGIPFDERLLRVMTVLVIACPCALVLATPTAVVATVGAAAKHGALIKGGAVLENMAKITTVCFDKTGTITSGKPELVDIRTFGGNTIDEVLTAAAAAEKHSGHPLAHAVLSYAEAFGITEIPEGEHFRMNFGRGVEIMLDGRRVEVCSGSYLEERFESISADVLEYIKDQENSGRTPLAVIMGGELTGCLSIADKIRPEAGSVIKQLKSLGLRRLIMLTGDNEVTAAAIAEEAGITEFKAGLLPEQKLRYIESLQADGEAVLMIGDGVNDAPALTLADAGIAMGVVGTDAAVESSDISLMTDGLSLVPQLLMAGRRTLAIVKQNIFIFAVLVNIIGIWLSGIGFLTPIAAAVVHNAASLFVVINSARLLNYKYDKGGVH